MVYLIFNEDLEWPEYLRETRLMLLSKSKVMARVVELNEIRPIAIESVVLKIIELVWHRLTEENIWGYIQMTQMGFRKGGSVMSNIIKDMIARISGKVMIKVDI